MTLPEYLMKHTTIVMPDNQTENDAIDTHFLKVYMVNSPNVSDFKDLISNYTGEFTTIDPFDGNEHSYIQLGAYLGSQDLALRFMALGQYLDLWEILTPERMFGSSLIQTTIDILAEQGLVTIKAPTPEEPLNDN